MPGFEDTWVELSSHNERIIRAGDSVSSPADSASPAAQSRWAELASQSERLVDDSDPLFRLASSNQTGTGMRLVAGVA